jgi:sugar lactone lactonase YvrE
MVTSGKLQLVVDAKAILGEGPCWDGGRNLLYWVDITGNKLHIHDSVAHTNRVIEVDQSPGAVVLRRSGGAVLAMKDGFYALDLETEQLTLLAKPDGEPPSNRFNDGKCDAAGRLWAGTMPLQGGDPVGSLYCLKPELQIIHVFGGVCCSNGIAWSPDNHTMYYIDSPTRQIVAFDYDLQQGSVASKRVVVQIPVGEGVPDGMTIDAEGMLWVAQWDGWQVSRWNPHNGNRLEQIRLPAARVTSCTFGGAGLDELYITTARSGLDEKELAEQPLAGGLFKIKTDVSGRESQVFNG